MAASTFASDAPVRAALAPVLSLSGYGWTPPGARAPVLDDVSLQLAPGECALLEGATGAGKSTLLRAIAGALPPGGASRGSLRVAGRVALLFQDVDTQLLFSTVDEEVASGLPGVARGPERARRVEAALAEVGLEGFGGRSVVDLSAGERQRVVLAALLASEPALLLLDEPTSALDPPGRAHLLSALARLKARGHSLLVAEHRTAPFRELADGCFVLEAGRIVPSGPVPDPAAPTRPPASAVASLEAIVRCTGVGVRDGLGRTRLPATDLVVHRGDRVLVCGANGAGKTTLLHVLAGLTAPGPGRVDYGESLLVGGEGRSRVRTGQVALALQNPPRNLFAPSVAEELAFPLLRSGWPRERVEPRVRELLDACGLAGRGDLSPLRLSFGQQHGLAIASALAPRPQLLLLDEPFAGLDDAARRRLLERIEDEQARTGMAVVIAVHDAAGLEGWARQRLVLPSPEPGRTGPRLATARGPLDAIPRQADTEAPADAGRPAPAGRAWHYRETGSVLHRLGVPWKLLAVVLGGIAAIAARTPLALAALLLGWTAGYRLARLRPSELWQDVRWLLLQGALIVGLSAARAGMAGALAGLQAACQVALLFLPGALLLRTTPAGRLMEGLQRALPPRLAFALATSLRFAPFFSRELHEILGVQRLRGARLAPRDLWRPRAWRDAVECAGVPLAVRLIHTANEVARAAEVRGIAALGIEKSADERAEKSAEEIRR